MTAPDAVAKPSNQEIADFDHYAGRYAAAVAERLIAEGFPVVDLDTDPPALIDGKRHEGEVWLFFSPDFRRQFESVDSMSLSWNEVSGWYFSRDVNGDQVDDRYLGQGLVPEAARVATFMTTVQLDPTGAGSRDRPFYRTGGPFPASLVEQLARYAAGTMTYKEAFTSARHRLFERRIATAIAADPPGPAVNLPLLPGEFAALELALEWVTGLAQAHDEEDDVLGALAKDIRSRRGADAADISRFRTTLAPAHEKVKIYREYDARRREKDAG